MTRILGDALVWDAHSFTPLSRDVDIATLYRHRDAGVDYVSINAAMDFNPWPETLRLMAHFRARLAEHAHALRLVGSVAELARAKEDGVLAVSFDLEGSDMLDGDLDMLRLYRDLGVRQIHLAYNRTSAAGSGCHAFEEGTDAGLTPFGRKVVAEVNRLGLVMDCSHTGHRTSMDVMAHSTKPVVFSHANVRALVDHPRNLRDDQIDACAATGGVIGLCGIALFLGGAGGAAEMVRHVDYVAQRVGPAHIGLGLDYAIGPKLNDNPPGLVEDDWWPARYGYGSVRRYLPPEALPDVVEGLSRLGYREGDLKGFLGANFLRVAAQSWNA